MRTFTVGLFNVWAILNASAHEIRINSDLIIANERAAFVSGLRFGDYEECRVEVVVSSKAEDVLCISSAGDEVIKVWYDRKELAKGRLIGAGVNTNKYSEVVASAVIKDDDLVEFEPFSVPRDELVSEVARIISNPVKVIYTPHIKGGVGGIGAAIFDNPAEVIFFEYGYYDGRIRFLEQVGSSGRHKARRLYRWVLLRGELVIVNPADGSGK
jgi:hypothetical protein